MDSPGSRPSGGAWVAPPADGLVLYRSARSSQRSVQSSESNKLPARQPAQPEASRMSGKGAYPKEQVSCPKCWNRVQRQYMQTCIRGDDARNTVSEYVAALQGGLGAAYRHAREGLQRAALHQKHDYDGKVQRREYQAGELVWIHDITLERTRGMKLQFPWFGLVLITKVLDRGRVVVRLKRERKLN